jgi:hypothetical protein
MTGGGQGWKHAVLAAVMVWELLDLELKGTFLAMVVDGEPWVLDPLSEWVEWPAGLEVARSGGAESGLAFKRQQPRRSRLLPEREWAASQWRELG